MIQKQIVFVLLLLIILFGCKNSASSNKSIIETSNVTIANDFIDAFYSFNSDALTKVLSNAKESQPNILYYQKWAACGNYAITKKNDFIAVSDSVIICPITVKDDLIGALNIDFHVTDTFHITIINNKIRSIRNSSNDPDMYYKAKEWVKLNTPELIEKPCEGIWAGGPTPCECVEGMVKGFGKFIASTPNK